MRFSGKIYIQEKKNRRNFTKGTKKSHAKEEQDKKRRMPNETKSIEEQKKETHTQTTKLIIVIFSRTTSDCRVIQKSIEDINIYSPEQEYATQYRGNLMYMSRDLRKRE